MQFFLKDCITCFSKLYMQSFSVIDCYRPQRSWAKVMFLQASVILLTGGCLPQCMLGYTPPKSRQPPKSRHPQSRHPSKSRHPPETDTPPGSRHPPQEQTPPSRSRLRHTVNERPVRILLECILVIGLHMKFVWTSNKVYLQTVFQTFLKN